MDIPNRLIADVPDSIDDRPIANCQLGAAIMRVVSSLFLVIAMSGCASVSAIPLSADSFQITSHGMSGCSPEGAQKVAFQQAAVETIRRGYDSFVITGTERQSDLASASSWGGGSASYGHVYSQGLTVKMFKGDDPEGAKAIPARETLGPKWQEALQQQGAVACT